MENKIANNASLIVSVSNLELDGKKGKYTKKMEIRISSEALSDILDENTDTTFLHSYNIKSVSSDTEFGEHKFSLTDCVNEKKTLLPKEMEVSISFEEINDIVSDTISDTTGFCVAGYSVDSVSLKV